MLFRLHIVLIKCVTKGSDLGLESLFADLYLPKKGSEELEQLVAEGTGIVTRAISARRRARGEGGPKYAPPSLAGEARYRAPGARAATGGASGGGVQGEDAEEEPDWAASLAGREDPNPFLPKSGSGGGGGGGGGGDDGKFRQIALPASLR